jgi:predicted ATPase
MSVFVGRQNELQQLKNHLHSVQGGKGRVVFITGEPGAGKSTLINRFMLDAALENPTTRIIGSICSEQYGAAEPYQPFVEAFRSLVSDERKTSGTWSNLKELAAEVAPHWINAIPVAGGLIAASISTAAELKKMGGGVATAASEEALFHQYTELFLSAAAEAPIVLFIDDLHWADRASVSLLTHLARRVERERVLILGTYRPADVDITKHPIRTAQLELERYGIAQEFPLSPLDSAANAQLIDEELGGPPTPELHEWMEQHAGSNPLFFAELLKWLVEQGFVREHHGEWTLARVPESIEVPRSAEATIERRLGLLDPEVYKIIEYASVEGNEFGSTTLSQLLAMDELELEEALEPLARLHRLVRMIDTRELPSGDLSSIYRFSHSLIREVLHRNLQGKRRILLHRKMAEILEQLHAGDSGAIAHKLAIHFDEGRLPARAYEFALMGAEAARRVYAHRDAIELIKRAQRNARDDAQRLRALELLGDTSHFIGHGADALAAYKEALKLVEASGDARHEIKIRRCLMTVDADLGALPPETIEQQLDELAIRARALQVFDELVEILWFWNVALRAGAAVERAREALAICDRGDNPARTARAHFVLARALLNHGELAAAIPHLHSALRLYEELNDPLSIGNCQNVLGAVHTFQAELKLASESFRAAAKAFDLVKAPYQEASVRNNLGVVLLRLGEWDAAEETLREAIRLNVRMHAIGELLHPLENLADLFQTAGRWREASEQWGVLLDHALHAGYWNAEVIARCGMGVAAVEQGDTESARAQHAAASAKLAEHEEWSEARAAHSFLSAKLAAAAGDHEAAVELLRSAENELEQHDRYVWATFRLLRAEIMAGRNDMQAEALAREVLTLFEQAGNEHMRQRVLHILSTTPEAA